MRQPGQGLCHATAMQGVQRPSLDPEGQADRVEAGLTWLHSVFFCISFVFFSVVHSNTCVKINLMPARRRSRA